MKSRKRRHYRKWKQLEINTRKWAKRLGFSFPTWWRDIAPYLGPCP